MVIIFRSCWRDSETKRRLKRYLQILKDEVKARYLIAKETFVDVSLDAPTDVLWRAHDEAQGYFMHDRGKGKTTYLDLKIELARRMLHDCIFCERRCHVDRTKKVGFCRVDDDCYVASAFLHPGEEPQLVPSGTIFFSSCNFRCVFCQNWDISTRVDGRVVTPKGLAKIANTLAEHGALNINYVGGDPTPHLYHILASLKYQTYNITQLWNSNLYLSEEAMKLLIDIIDLWLPDFKYGNNECALRLSKVNKYFDVVSRNHKMIADYGGEIIIRHLVLPGHLECCTYPVLEWIAKNVPQALVNIMDQYHPDHLVPSDPNYKDINRFVSAREMKLAYEYADSLGIVWRPVTK